MVCCCLIQLAGSIGIGGFWGWIAISQSTIYLRCIVRVGHNRPGAMVRGNLAVNAGAMPHPDTRRQCNPPNRGSICMCCRVRYFTNNSLNIQMCFGCHCPLYGNPYHTCLRHQHRTLTLLMIFGDSPSRHYRPISGIGLPVAQ